MRNVVLLLVSFSLLSGFTLRAGDVVLLSNGTESTGKLTLSASSIHLDRSTPVDIAFSDVLEASFSDAPFQLDYFATTSDMNQLPSDWKGSDFGAVQVPGSTTVKAGVITLTGAGGDLHEGERRYFIGRPWSGNGQFTIHIAGGIDPEQRSQIGILLRDNLLPDQPYFGLSAFAEEKGLYVYRGKTSGPGWGGDFQLDVPIWLRITRAGPNMSGSMSKDGKSWSACGLYQSDVAMNALVGFFINSNDSKRVGKGEIDHVTFTPPPSSAQVLSSGVLLCSGSFIAGVLNPLDFPADATEYKGRFRRGDTDVSILSTQIAFSIMQPTPRSQLTKLGSEVGLVMKNGDFLSGNFEAINAGGVRLSSVLLGVVSYNISDTGVCVLNPLKPQPADYEVRLTDGSIIRASGFSVENGQIVIGEVSGVAIPVKNEEVAQLRAGSARAQNLLELPYQVLAPTPPPAPVAPAAPGAPPASSTEIPCWGGPGQEQILVLPNGNGVEFPLAGKFRAVALRIALLADAPPGTQATVRILADGRELGRTPPFRAGDPPRFVQLTLPATATRLTFVAESIFAGTKVLLIDPVAIRETTP